jgi:hypothetical protein
MRAQVEPRFNVAEEKRSFPNDKRIGFLFLFALFFVLLLLSALLRVSGLQSVSQRFDNATS